MIPQVSSHGPTQQRARRTVARYEWIWVAVAASLVVTASTVPYVAGHLTQTPKLVFGGAVLDTPDYHSHLAKMWQGHRGSWRYRLLFTPEDHEGAYLQTFYVALGHIARVSGLGLAVTYQIARVALALLVLFTVYRFIAHFVLPVRLRRIAFLLATLASGLGWIREIIAPTAVGGVSPMSFWLIDGYTYLSLLTFPHFSLAIALLLAIFLLLLRESEGPSLKAGAGAALLSLLLGVVHPYMLLVADLVPALYWTIDEFGTRRMWRGWLTLAGMGLVQAPILAYDVWVFRTHAVFAAWSAQNVTLSPPISAYLWGYGFLIALALIGARASRRQSTRDVLFLWLWIGLISVLIYLPWNLQRRFLEGVQVPLAILAGIGLTRVVGSIPYHRIRRSGPIAVAALAATGNLYMTIALTWGAGTRHPALFWPHDVIAAVDWLGAHSEWNQTVLGAPDTGTLIAGRIGHRVVIGHEMETVDFEQKRMAVNRFYDVNTTEAERRSLLHRWQVEYVAYGPYEQALGDFSPSDSESLVPLYDQNGLIVYEVQR